MRQDRLVMSREDKTQFFPHDRENNLIKKGE
jgi:hypothetical protein